MKRVLTILPLTALCISTMQAQHKNEYTNFADTTFNIQEVVATAARKPRPQITKLDVPMKYLPISINSITASSLELRGIRNIQDAVRFMRAYDSRHLMAHFNNCRSVVSIILS